MQIGTAVAGTTASSNDSTLACLRDLVQTLPVPTTPRPRSRSDEQLGLGVLELSLRLSHVSRLTEHLELLERGHLGRRISLDVDLQALNQRHQAAISAGDDMFDEFLWVPIARHDRRDLAAVVVTDGSGTVVPRLTNRESTRITAAAILQLFRMLLDADPTAATDGKPIYKLRTEWHRARWLIESAVTTLIDQGLPSSEASVRGAVRGRRSASERGRESLIEVLPEGDRESQWPSAVPQPPVVLEPAVVPAPEATPDPVPLPAMTGPGVKGLGAQGPEAPAQEARSADADPDDDAADGSKQRGHALAVLEQLFEPVDESTFLPLLRIAAVEHPLVVLLSNATPKQYLSFEAPHLRDREPRRLRLPDWAGIRSALRPRQEFTMEYETSIPRSVNSFHMSLSVAPGVHVRHCFMSTSADVTMVDTLLLDMAECASASQRLVTDGHGALLELELASIASRLRDLGDRRVRDMSRFRGAWNLDFQGHLTRAASDAAATGQPPPTNGGVIEPAHPVCSLACFSHDISTEAYERLGGVAFDAQVLATTAEALKDSDLGWDLTTDNDPREDHAHLHWRRPDQPSGSKSTDPLAARLVVTLADDPPSLAASVCRMTLTLAALLAGVVAFLTHDVRALLPWLAAGEGVFDHAEAAVTILLLVPGLLLSRLDLPSTNTVLGQLRMLSRVVAYLAVSTTTLAAAYVALHLNGSVELRPLRVACYMLLALGLYAGLSLAVQAYTDGSLVPRSVMVPKWLAHECTRDGLRPNRPPSARFAVVEGRRR